MLISVYDCKETPTFLRWRIPIKFSSHIHVHKLPGFKSQFHLCWRHNKTVKLKLLKDLSVMMLPVDTAHLSLCSMLLSSENWSSLYWANKWLHLMLSSWHQQADQQLLQLYILQTEVTLSLGRKCHHERELSEGTDQSASVPAKVNPSATDKNQAIWYETWGLDSCVVADCLLGCFAMSPG